MITIDKNVWMSHDVTTMSMVVLGHHLTSLDITMARNKLFSIRLTDEIIQALQDKFPGLSTVEGIRACIEEVLGMTSHGHPIDVIGTVNEILQTVYLRLDKLERAIATPDNQEDKDITTTQEVQEDSDIHGTIRDITTTSPDNQEVQEVQEDSDIHGTIRDITTTSPDNQEVQEVQEDSDIHGTIRDILAINPGTSSLRGIVDLLKKNKVRIPGKGGLVQPTIQNVKPYLVDRQG